MSVFNEKITKNTLIVNVSSEHPNSSQVVQHYLQFQNSARVMKTIQTGTLYYQFE